MTGYLVVLLFILRNLSGIYSQDVLFEEYQNKEGREIPLWPYSDSNSGENVNPIKQPGDEKPLRTDDYFEELLQNDPNLAPGFNLRAFRYNQLNLHNYYRALHRTRPLRLSYRLNRQAQEYAEKLASQRILPLKHCKSPYCNNYGAGENLATGYSQNLNPTVNATKLWYDEIWAYDFCNKDDYGGRRPGHQGEDIGHFTQVVWKGSSQLGIGAARTRDGSRIYVVARYRSPGNVQGLFKKNVLQPHYISKTYQKNCHRVSGRFSRWSVGKCSQICGGGIQLKSRTCTNPKPSLNGRDCRGATTTIAKKKWCNTDKCRGKKSHRDLQCEHRGYRPDAYGAQNCRLYCLSKGNKVYKSVGLVEDGAHCKKGVGACLAGKCVTGFPKYVETSATGIIQSGYKEKPSPQWWKNRFLEIPNGVRNVLIKNRNYRAVQIYVGYTTSSRKLGYNWGENGVPLRLFPYKRTFTVYGVPFIYKRLNNRVSTIKFNGPVRPKGGVSLVFFALGKVRADITWSYRTAKTV